MTSTRSARNTASGIECVISSTVFFVSRWIRISSTFMRSRVSASSAPNGSSISMILGSCTSALLHAAGELPGQLLLEAFQPDHLQQRLGAFEIFLPRQPLHVDRQHHVGQNVAP